MRGSNKPVERAVQDAAPLGVRSLLAFSTMAIPVSAAQLPLTVYLPAIYAQQFGLSLGAVGAIFLFEKLWGAAADPLVGAMSDHLQSRWGRRRPLIAAGALLLGLSGYFLFFPRGHVSPGYLVAFLFFFFLGWSLIQIPYYAWSGEVSDRYHERTRIVAFQAMLGSAALLLVVLLPTAVEQLRLEGRFIKLNAIGFFILASIPPALWFTFRALPEPHRLKTSKSRSGVASSVALLVQNTALLRVMTSDFIVNVGGNIRAGLLIFFVSAYMGRPQLASTLLLMQLVVALASAPLCSRIARQFGKHRAVVAVEFAQAAINLALLLVTPARFGLLLSLTVAQGLLQGSGNMALRAMVADVSDAHQADAGEDRAGLFFSIFSISAKAGAAIALGVALPLVGWLGFDPHASRNSVQALLALKLVFALGPAVGHLAGGFVILGFPIDEAVHREIQIKLSERALIAPVNESDPLAGAAPPSPLAGAPVL